MKFDPEPSHLPQAIAIAKEGLRWCYRERGIMSGSRLVYWSWDSFFAGMGALRIGDREIVHKNLELYLSLQRKDGAVPKRIANPLYWMGLLGFPISEAAHLQRPTFANSYYTAVSLAQNPILIIAVHDYVTFTGDHAFAKQYFEQLRAVEHYLKKFEDNNGLLQEGAGGGWAESVLKRGAISFTNMCYARSLWCMAELAALLNLEGKEGHYRERFRRTKDEINRRLWWDEDGGYYSDWLEGRRHHHFATDGNLLAILWDIADERRTQHIQRKIEQLALEDDVPIRLAYDQYSFWRIFIFSRLGGLKDYHVGFCWTWLGCIDALAKHKIGNTKEAEKILERIAKVIVRDGAVFETYDRGKPVHTLFYKSETPWAWGAGLFLYACSVIKGVGTNL